MRPFFSSPSSSTLPWRQRPRLIASPLCPRHRIHLWPLLTDPRGDSDTRRELLDYRECGWPDYRKKWVRLWDKETGRNLDRHRMAEVRLRYLRSGRFLSFREDPFRELHQLSLAVPKPLGRAWKLPDPDFDLVEIGFEAQLDSTFDSSFHFPFHAPLGPPFEVARPPGLEFRMPIDITPADLRRVLTRAYHFLRHPYASRNDPVEFHIEAPRSGKQYKQRPMKWAMLERVDLSPDAIQHAMPDGSFLLTKPRINKHGTDVVWLLAAKHLTINDRDGRRLAAWVERKIKSEQKLLQSSGGKRGVPKS